MPYLLPHHNARASAQHARADHERGIVPRTAEDDRADLQRYRAALSQGDKLPAAQFNMIARAAGQLATKLESTDAQR